MLNSRRVDKLPREGIFFVVIHFRSLEHLSEFHLFQNLSTIRRRAKTDFETALNAARTALNDAPSPFMANLVRALGNYNRATTDVLLAVLQRIDDVNRNVNGVAMRLDGKPGPYNLKMR